MAYVKPWRSYEDQLALLVSRGLEVTDPPKAVECLRRIGYARLSGYWYPFRERSGLLTLLDEHGRKPAKKQRKETRVALDDFRSGATRAISGYQGPVALILMIRRLSNDRYPVSRYQGAFL